MQIHKDTMAYKPSPSVSEIKKLHIELKKKWKEDGYQPGFDFVGYLVKFDENALRQDRLRSLRQLEECKNALKKLTFN